MQDDAAVRTVVAALATPSPPGAKQRWWITSAAAIPLAAAGGTALAVGAGVPLALGLVGFSGPGVAAGSAAAAWQASIGNVASGSVFAYLQACGAAGIGTTLPTVAGAMAGGATGAGMHQRRLGALFRNKYVSNGAKGLWSCTRCVATFPFRRRSKL